MCDHWKDFQKQALPRMRVLISYSERFKKLSVFKNLILYVLYMAMIKILTLVNQLLTFQSV